MVRIIQRDDKDSAVLRAKAQEVPISDITSLKLKKIIADMKEAAHSQDDAVAVAAPQIGEPLRMFVVVGKLFSQNDSKKSDDRVFVNPKIIKRSRKKEKVDEGCLSVRPLYGLVERSDKVTIRAYDEHGKQFEYGASGVLAQIFQHELDHLEGILFTDKTSVTWEFYPENNEG